MLLVQNFLTTHTLQDLIEQHGVYATPSADCRKISINYSQIEAKNDDLLAQECRGLIIANNDHEQFQTIKSESGRVTLNLDVVIGKTKRVAYPFNRFFNHGMEAAVVDWLDPRLRVLEKVDGTLMIVYFDTYQNQWHAATRSVSEANILLNDTHTFRILFEEGLKSHDTTFAKLTSRLDEGITYMFELTSFYNRVVVDYKITSTTLLGARNTQSKQELDVSRIDVGIPVVSTYELKDINEVLKHVEKLNPIESEGVIILDSNFNRIKIKSAAYVALHHTINSIAASKRNLLTLILAENDDDVLASLPDALAESLTDMKDRLVQYAITFDTNFKSYKELSRNSDNERKSFALLLKKSNVRFCAPYFQVYAGNSNSFFEFTHNARKGGKWTSGFLDNILEEIGLG